MRYERWYDKDQYLSPIMKILEQLPADLRAIVAQDLLQNIMNTNNATCDEKIDFLNRNIPPTYRRWYDKDTNLHSAIESLKNMPAKQKKQICEEIIDFLFQLIANREQTVNE